MAPERRGLGQSLPVVAEVVKDGLGPLLVSAQASGVASFTARCHVPGSLPSE